MVMKLVERGEILGLAEYEAVRERFRARVIAEKKLRRVQLGPRATAVFENHDTMLMQVQEMLRTERITRPAAVQHEIDTYNEIVPGQDELSCTIMIEIVDKAERDAFLQAALGFERHVWLVAGGEHVPARAIDRGAPQDRTTAVHYLKFGLPPSTAAALRSAAPIEVVLEVDHPAYAARAVLSRETVASLAEDLQS
jgi:Protein of unknown function (DUF3501)